MAVSTAPVAQQNLLALLALRAGLSGVGLNWAAPVDADLYAPSGDDIYLGDVNQTQEWAAINRTVLPKDEHYTLQVFAQAYRQGNDPQGTATRAWALVAEIENQLRADPTINGALNRPAQVQSTLMSTKPADPQAWLAKATVQVACWARI